jgi:hypothetical protein
MRNVKNISIRKPEGICSVWVPGVKEKIILENKIWGYGLHSSNSRDSPMYTVMDSPSGWIKDKNLLSTWAITDFLKENSGQWN